MAAMFGALRIDLSDTLGALLIGVFISAILYGATCLQTFYYFQNYTSDKLLLKLLVTMLLASETLHAVFSIYSVYYYTITNYSDLDPLIRTNWSISAVYAQSSISIFAVHTFYTRRVYYMSQKNVPLTIVIVVLSLVHFGSHVFSTVEGFQFLSDDQRWTYVPAYLSVSLFLAAVTDITIVASLTHYLRKNKSGMQNTDTIVNYLITHIVGNGILTTVVDILVLIFAIVNRNMIYLAIYQVVANLYANSVLASLNSRRSLTRAGEVTRISFVLPLSGHETSTQNRTEGTRGHEAQ
ncbi:hypothetical protein BDZ94DRAFT_1048553 [Collybia nuda]|uniref:DUF6534 domain-containing protein n=1 Tax=Collybia nuda TaxID=64659 RepID=A0A9P6CBC0_9AGAR|nr:hypothetical protein BDZ94DRAFT_1048553 [Collybia nuda]